MGFDSTRSSEGRAPEFLVVCALWTDRREAKRGDRKRKNPPGENGSCLDKPMLLDACPVTCSKGANGSGQYPKSCVCRLSVHGGITGSRCQCKLLNSSAPTDTADIDHEGIYETPYDLPGTLELVMDARTPVVL